MQNDRREFLANTQDLRFQKFKRMSIEELTKIYKGYKNNLQGLYKIFELPEFLNNYEAINRSYSYYLHPMTWLWLSFCQAEPKINQFLQTGNPPEIHSKSLHSASIFTGKIFLSIHF